MNTHLTDQQLNAYIHQTLNDAQRETLDAHLAGCPACRAHLNELDVLQQRVRRELAAELKAVNVPLSLTFETIAPRLQPPSRATRLWRYSRQALLGVTAVAALLVVMLVLANTSSPTAVQIGGRLISDTGRVGGWTIGGDDPASYEFGIDQSVAHTGQASGFIRSKVAAPTGFGALMQQTVADSYLGKRVRFSAYLRTEGVEGYASLWLRIDGPQGKILGFDNMDDRPIQGTTEWQRYNLVLDVPEEAISVNFGAFLMGRGQMWIDDVQLEAVGQEVAITAATKEPSAANARPLNLDFEAGLDGWTPESTSQNYATGIDTVNVHGGQASGHIQSQQANPLGVAALSQYIKADTYRGKRLRVTAYVKFEKVDATAYFVADTFASPDTMLTNNKDVIYSTPLWQRQSIVFDVPENSDRIAAGVILEGEGQIWIDDVQVEVVGTDVALTISDQESGTAAQPGVLTSHDLDQSFSGWFIAGTRPQDYEMGFDSEVVHTGKSSAYVKSVASFAPEFGTFMFMGDAANYRGKRVRFSGYAKAEQVGNWAGLWMRVDGLESTTLSFDNMQNRPIQGTRDWQKYEVVLDVPENSVQIAYGILLAGKGQVWLDDVQVEVVDQSVPTTGLGSKQPADLGFEIDDHSWAAPQENATAVPTIQVMTDATATPNMPSIRFGGVATLVNPLLTRDKFFPGEEIPLTLFWYVPSPTNTDYSSFVHVLDKQGQLVAQADSPLRGADIDSIGFPPPNYTVDLGGNILLPLDLPPGQYQVVVGIYDTQSRQRLTTDQGETTATIGTIEVVTPLARFGNRVTLTDVKLPTTKPAAGEALELSLRWIVSATNPVTLNTSVHVIDSQGNLAAQSDQPLAQTETSVQTITLQLPTTMASGAYQIVVGVYDATTGSRLTTDNGETTTTIGTIEVEASLARFGDVATLISALLNNNYRFKPEETLTLELSWDISQAEGYTSFVHVLDSQDQLVAQADLSLAEIKAKNVRGQPQKPYLIGQSKIPLPADLPDGEYRLAVGIYDNQTGQRVTNHLGQTAVMIAFEVRADWTVTADTKHVHLVNNSTEYVVSTVSHFETAIRNACADLGCDTQPMTCVDSTEGGMSCSPYSPALTVTVYIDPKATALYGWMYEDQLMFKIPTPSSPRGSQSVFEVPDSLTLLVEKVARSVYGWPPQTMSGLAIFYGIVDWETYQLNQRLGNARLSNPFQPDQLTGTPVPSLESLWVPGPNVSVTREMQVEAAALIEFVEKEFGVPAVSKLLKAIGRANSLPEAIESSLNITYADFEQRWRDWLKQYDIK